MKDREVGGLGRGNRSSGDLSSDMRSIRSGFNDPRLSSDQLRLLSYLDVDPLREYSYSQLSKALGLSEGTLRNWFSSDYEGLLDRYCHKIYKGRSVFIRGVVKRNVLVVEELARALSSDELYSLFEDLFYRQAESLGIHKLSLHLKDDTIKSFYATCGWGLAKGNSKQKIKVIKGKIEEFGETYVLISSGKQSEPSIEIRYNGTVGSSKDYISLKDYSTWYSLVDQFIRNVLHRPHGLEKFFILSMEINYDQPLTDKRSVKSKHFKKAVRVRELNLAMEIYEYSLGGDVEKGRIGREIELKEGETISDEPSRYLSVERLLSGFFLSAHSMDKQNDMIAMELPSMKRALHALINNYTQIHETYELMKDNFHDFADKVYEYQKKLGSKIESEASDTLKSLKKDLKQSLSDSFSPLIESFEAFNEFLVDFKNDLPAILTPLKEDHATLLRLVPLMVKTLHENSKAIKHLSETDEKIINTASENQDLLLDTFKALEEKVIDDIHMFQTSQNETNKTLNDTNEKVLALNESVQEQIQQAHADQAQINADLISVIRSINTTLDNQTRSINTLLRYEEDRQKRREEKDNKSSWLGRLKQRVFKSKN